MPDTGTRAPLHALVSKSCVGQEIQCVDSSSFAACIYLTLTWNRHSTPPARWRLCLWKEASTAGRATAGTFFFFITLKPRVE